MNPQQQNVELIQAALDTKIDERFKQIVNSQNQSKNSNTTAIIAIVFLIILIVAAAVYYFKFYKTSDESNTQPQTQVKKYKEPQVLGMSKGKLVTSTPIIGTEQ